MSKNSLSKYIFISIPLWILSYITNILFIADFASLVGTLLMGYQLWEIIGNSQKMTKLLRIGIINMVLIQNLSWLLSSTIHRFFLNIPLDISLYQQLKLTISDYSVAIVYVSIFALFLSYLSRSKKFNDLENKISYLLFSLQFIQLNKIKFTLLVTSLFNILLIALGVIGQRAIIVEGFKTGEIPFWYPFFDMLNPFIIIVNVVYYVKLSNQIHVKLYNWINLIVSFVCIGFIYFSKGRGPFLLMLLFHLYWFYFFIRVRPNFKKLFLLFIFTYPVISFLMLLSNFVRSVNLNVDISNTSAIEVFSLAIKAFQSDDSNQREERERSINNLSMRPLVTHPLALCLKLPDEKKNFTLGENIKNSFIWSIPRFLFQEKEKYPQQEDLLYKNFPIGKDDTADSLYLFSYVDFGWFGILCYPLLLIFYWRFILITIHFFKPSPYFSTLIIASFQELFTLGVGESALSSWFVALRVFIFIILLSFVTNIFSKNRDNIKAISLQ